MGKGAAQPAAPGRCQITCRLHKGNYIGGEQVAGFLSITTPASDGASSALILTQASVRAHGHARVDPRWTNLPKPLRTLYQQDKEEPAGDSSSPSVRRRRPRYKDLDNANTVCIFSTDCVVLPLDDDDNSSSTHPVDTVNGDGDGAADAAPPPRQQQQPRPSKTYAYSFTFRAPRDVPPSFKGVVARYLYFATVTVTLARHAASPAAGWGVGRLLGAVRRRSSGGSGSGNGGAEAVTVTTEEHSLHLPFALLATGRPPREAPALPPDVCWATLQAQLEHASEAEDGAQGSSGSGSANAGQRPLLLARTHASVWDLQGKARGGTGGHPLVFGIRSGDARILRFMLYKREFWPGDLVLGTFDMAGADCTCHQICACLLVEERAAAAAWHGDGGAAAAAGRGGGSAAAAAEAAATQAHQRIVDVFHELGPCAQTTSMALALPADAPLSFATDLDAVRWLLRFEFTIGAARTAAAPPSAAPAAAADNPTPRGGARPSRTNSILSIGGPGVLAGVSEPAAAAAAPEQYRVLRWEVPIAVVTPAASAEAPRPPFASQEGAVERTAFC
ncbi:hypothetical protein JKP88DRAFT_352467 [Tribonema minus]|uniref:Uncharacterized protein n=1 Tax=Tribonema minus TaxID=303371 RepID=A0A836CMY4_9STRA|nr:hypothetical protein JKP88DRAFT_352467 [Tribonema minus]